MWRMKKIPLFCVALFLLAATALAAEGPGNAYTSPSGVFSAVFPAPYQQKLTRLSLGPGRDVQAEEAAAVIDQRPYQPSLKTYAIRAAQTIGPPLTPEEQTAYLQRDIAAFEAQARKLGGAVHEKKQSNDRRSPGMVLAYAYNDPALGVQIVKARMIAGDRFIIQQIVTGNQETAESFKTRDFFQSLILQEDGRPSRQTGKAAAWKPVLAPNGFFTVRVPETSEAFFPQTPVFKSNQTNDLVALSFNDPVRRQALLMNVYGYRVDRDIDFKAAQEVLAQNHIARQGAAIAGIKFQKDFDEAKHSRLQTAYAIAPPAGYPYMTGARLRGVFDGREMMVTELLGPPALVNSGFADFLLTQAAFKPGPASPSQPSARPASGPATVP